MPDENQTSDWRFEREFTRSETQFKVEVVGDAWKAEGELRDVGARGVFVLCESPFPVGVDCSVSIVLEDEQVETATRIEASGRTVRVDDEGMAIEFVEIGLESFEHLKNLVLLNSPRPDAVGSEFDGHLGLKSRPARGMSE